MIQTYSIARQPYHDVNLSINHVVEGRIWYSMTQNMLPIRRVVQPVLVSVSQLSYGVAGYAGY